MRGVAYIIDNSIEIVLALFAGIGLFFTYRAWRQRQDDLHEKYFERRYNLFMEIENAIENGVNRPEQMENWWHPLMNSLWRAEFLFGQAVRQRLQEVFDLLNEYHDAREISDSDERVKKCKQIRADLISRHALLREEMATHISVLK